MRVFNYHHDSQKKKPNTANFKIKERPSYRIHHDSLYLQQINTNNALPKWPASQNNLE